MIFQYDTIVHTDWIDYNGHMRDAFYGLIFSYAVDAMQDEIGFDQAYRDRTGNTIYLVEDHKFFLREVRKGDHLDVQTRVLDCDEKRFHLHLTMLHEQQVVCVCEFLELHVCQHPEPHAAAMPQEIAARLSQAKASDSDIATLTHRARSIGLRKS